MGETAGQVSAEQGVGVPGDADQGIVASDRRRIEGVHSSATVGDEVLGEDRVLEEPATDLRDRAPRRCRRR